MKFNSKHLPFNIKTFDKEYCVHVDRECAEKSFERKPCAVTHNLTDVETPPGDEECREQISGSVYYLCRPKTLKFCSGYKVSYF